jgi:hypothetical protein
MRIRRGHFARELAARSIRPPDPRAFRSIERSFLAGQEILPSAFRTLAFLATNPKGELAVWVRAG